jgi:hypothetical protein
MVEHSATNTEGVSKVHRGHGSQRIDVFAFHPYTLCVVPANAIDEAVFLREQPRWHARIEDEYREGKEVRKSHGSSDDCKGVERRCNIVVPRNESVAEVSF